jgi:hypothetical protein
MSRHFYTFFPKNCDTKFVVKNIAPAGKRIKVFNYPIVNGGERDLLAIPEISEATIRHSLLKGELVNKLRCGELIVIDSNIDLLQFDECHKAFLESVGVNDGLEVETGGGTGTIPFLFKQGIELIGIKNSSNRVFTTPEAFINGTFGSNIFRILLRHNGRVLVLGIDYTVSESGGIGTGFDTITFISFKPKSKSELFADYVIEA